MLFFKSEMRMDVRKKYDIKALPKPVNRKQENYVKEIHRLN
jgi:hypothetical protein